MNLNILAILSATIAQFMVGAIWYSLLFGELWGRIHGFDKLSKAVQEKMMSQMGPAYGVQFLVTLTTSIVLSILMSNLNNFSGYYLALLLWLGFIVPAQVSAVLFGGVEGKWILKKILVQIGNSLICLLAAVATLNLF